MPGAASMPMSSITAGRIPLGDTRSAVSSGSARHEHAVRIGQLKIDANFFHLGVHKGAVFINPVVDQCAAMGDGGNRYEIRQMVNVEAGKDIGVDFVDRGA